MVGEFLIFLVEFREGEDTIVIIEMFVCLGEGDIWVWFFREDMGNCKFVEKFLFNLVFGVRVVVGEGRI